jgi:hypothetical protein
MIGVTAITRLRIELRPSMIIIGRIVERFKGELQIFILILQLNVLGFYNREKYHNHILNASELIGDNLCRLILKHLPVWVNRFRIHQIQSLIVFSFKL